MKVPLELANAFQEPFQEKIAEFAVQQSLMSQSSDIVSKRFLARSVAPHVQKLSSLFNRRAGDEIDHYWKKSSNPKNLKLSYFLSFMPGNLFRVASVWAELARLGYRWPKGARALRAVELGAGPASGACGILAGETHAAVGLPESQSWTLSDHNRSMVQLGSAWFSEFAAWLGFKSANARAVHSKTSIEEGFFPRGLASYDLWVMSYFLNEFDAAPEAVARALARAMETHLEEEGLAVIVEPALKSESRKLLAIRKALLELKEKQGWSWLKVLTPCLGEQACGALAKPEDWCHEEVTWWRPPYLRIIDDLCKLDRKSLPFSYLVLTKSKRPLREILPALSDSPPSETERLVSPARFEGRDLEFHVCGETGKRKARFRTETEIGRGTILKRVKTRGDRDSTRIESADRVEDRSN